jgi:hypothetical protein
MVVIMSIASEITDLINSIAPPKGIVGGFMSRNEIIQLIDKVANTAVAIGWTHGESITRKRLEKKLEVMEQEMTIIKEQMKALELDLLASESK